MQSVCSGNGASRLRACPMEERNAPPAATYNVKIKSTMNLKGDMQRPRQVKEYAKKKFQPDHLSRRRRAKGVLRTALHCLNITYM